MKIYAVRWKSMKIDESLEKNKKNKYKSSKQQQRYINIPWELMQINENPWKFIENQWKSFEAVKNGKNK